MEKEKKASQFLFHKPGECREMPGGEGKKCLVGTTYTWNSPKQWKTTRPDIKRHRLQPLHCPCQHFHNSSLDPNAVILPNSSLLKFSKSTARQDFDTASCGEGGNYSHPVSVSPRGQIPIFFLQHIIPKMWLSSCLNKQFNQQPKVSFYHPISQLDRIIIFHRLTTEVLSISWCQQNTRNCWIFY